MKRTAAVIRRELVLYSRDVAVVAILVVTPFVLVLLLAEPLRDLYALETAGGSRSIDSYAFISPRAATMFSFFGAGFVASSFYREQWFGYVDVLETLPLSRRVVSAGKLLVPWVLVLTCYLAISVLPPLVLGSNHELGMSVFGLIAAALATATLVVTVGVVLVRVTRTMAQVTQIMNLVVLAGGGAGGLLLPRESLATPVRLVGNLFPQRWLEYAITNASEGGTLTRSLLASVVVAGLSIVVGLVAVRGNDLQRLRLN